MDVGRSGQTERSLEQVFAMVRETGFHGLTIDLDSNSDKLAEAAGSLYRKHDLACRVNAFPSSMEDLLPILHQAQTLNAECVNVIARVLPNSVDEASLFVQDWLEEAERESVPVVFETHRNSLTNGLGFTAQLLDAVPEMKICADLSHYVVDHELELPVRDDVGELINRILQRSDSFQGRISSAQQIQLQLEFPQHQNWVVQFLDWWELGFRHWRKSAAEDQTMVFDIELGPPGYAMTGPDGMEMSDRWQESQTMKSWIENLWQRLDQEDIEQSLVAKNRQNDDNTADE